MDQRPANQRDSRQDCLGMEGEFHHKDPCAASDIEIIAALYVDNPYVVSLMSETLHPCSKLMGGHCSASMEEARASSKELHNMVQRVLESNEDISRRLNALEMPCNGSHSFIGTSNGDAEETIDDRETIRPDVDSSTDFQATFQIPDFSFTFDQDLQTSRVYTRAAHQQSNFSVRSAAVQSLSWSMISGISLSAVSNISVISLPISANELWNGQHYNPESHLQADTVTLNEFDGVHYADLAVRLKEEQLRREEAKLLEIETKIQLEIAEKRKELLLREEQLRAIEARLEREQRAEQEALSEAFVAPDKPMRVSKAQLDPRLRWRTSSQR